MSEVFEKFKHLFSTTTWLGSREPEEERQAEEEREKAEMEALRSLVSSPGLPLLVAAVESEIRSLRPDPRLGVEAAACAMFRQDGLRTALEIIERMRKRLEAYDAR